MTLLLMNAGGPADGSGGGGGGTPISNPVYAGHGGGSGSLTRDVAPLADIPAGALIIPALVTRSTVASVGVTDSVGNTYTVSAYKNHGSGGRLWLATCHNATSVPSSGYIRWTMDNAAWCVGVVDYIQNALTSGSVDVDAGPQTTTAVSGSFSLSTGAFSQTNEICMEYMTFWENPGTITPSTGFTGLTTAFASTTEYYLARSYKALSSTSSITLDASWSGSANPQNGGISVRSYKGS